MPRASRRFLPGQVWHITHRCHKKDFLLKFARDRRSYLQWLFESRKRFGLDARLYGDVQMVTSNHIHHEQVRAGVVQHPSEWKHGGYCEIQRPLGRYAVMDLASLGTLCGFLDIRQFQQAHQQGCMSTRRRSAARRALV